MPSQPPVMYTQADVSRALSSFEPLAKDGGVYVARLSEPMLIQTPPLTLVASLDDDEDGTPARHAHLALPPKFARFVKRVEAAVLDAGMANKAEWFRRPLEDDALRASFKPFLKDDILRVRLPRDVLVFDADGQLVERSSVGPGAAVRCLLDMSKLCFGRTEFGGMWSLVQAQTLPPPPAPPSPPRCLIDPLAHDEDLAHDGDLARDGDLAHDGAAGTEEADTDLGNGLDNGLDNGCDHLHDFL